MLTAQQAYEIALQHHQAGRLAEAEALYRQILAVQPDHAGVWHHLGVIAHQVGRHDVAVELIGKANTFDPNNPAAYSNLGGAYCAMGRRDEGIAALRWALRLKPDYAEAWNNLGNALRDQGDAIAAASAFQRALEIHADYAEAHNNLGNALQDQGRGEEAIAAYRRALQLKPAYGDAHSNLGIVLKAQDRLEEAIAEFRCALQINPASPEAHNNLGNALHQQGRYEEAIMAFQHALQLQPACVPALNNLGATLKEMGDLDEAAATFRKALEIQPDHVKARSNLGVALAEQGRLEEALAVHRSTIALDPSQSEFHNNLGVALSRGGLQDEAIAAFRQALHLKPDCVEAHNNLGAAYKEKGEFDEALAAFRRTLELKHAHAGAHNNLGTVLRERGEVTAALAAYRQSLAVDPRQASVHSNLVFALHFDPDSDGGSIADEQRRWTERFAEPVKRAFLPCANDRDPERRLRIGYVSADLREHVVGRYLLPLFQHHDHRTFEILCYAGVVQPDPLSEVIRANVEGWRSTVSVGDDALAEIIRRDRVDILVDLAQHTDGNRLPLFARQPAPVQVSFAGYPESSGLEAIEYRISDRWLESGMESFPGRERSANVPYPDRKVQVFLIDSFWCYDPCGVAVAVNALPTGESGRITFGSLNNFSKVNEPLLKLWARVLQQVEGARLVMLSGKGSHRQRAVEFLEHQGIEADRVEFVGRCSRGEYLKMYHRLDLVLDTFPYNGHTTSVDALWMGVPVVSLAGQTRVSRGGLSVLSNLGLPELVAHSEDEYVEIATRLAHDLPRLAELRRTLRARMETSVLMDAPRFARNIETAYRAMWRRWCAERTDAG